MTNRHINASISALAFSAIGLLLFPAPSSAQPATSSIPTPPPVRTPAPERRAPETSERPTGPTIEGIYAVEGSTAEIQVRRIFGDIYHLTSSDGWEGVGILEGRTDRSVMFVSSAQFQAWMRLPSPQCANGASSPPGRRAFLWRCGWRSRSSSACASGASQGPLAGPPYLCATSTSTIARSVDG
jgi:hypothetical protein